MTAKYMKEKVDRYEKVDMYVDSLLQRGYIEDEQDYVKWAKSLTITELSQHLVNQPEDTPTAEEIIDWLDHFS